MPLVPLIDSQRRMAEVGRIRLGRKVAMSGGRTRPEKLAKFRLTSRDRTRLDAAARLYGGDVTEWEGEWELYTAADAIPIAVVPGQAISRHYELWGKKDRADKSPVVCLRRCDGNYEAKSDGPCICAGEEEMACKPTTRLSVLLTDVPGLGVWRLESHGWNASAELAGTVELLELLVAAGRPIRARLRLDRRESRSETGVKKFVVPVIDIDHTMGQVLDSVGLVRDGSLETKSTVTPLTVERGFTPVPELPAAPAASIADQVGAVEDAAPAARPRRNAQQAIPPTGLAPRRADEVPAEDGHPSAGEGGGETESVRGPGSVPPPDEPPEVEDAPLLPAPSTPAPPAHDPDAVDDQTGGTMPLANRVAMWISELYYFLENGGDRPDDDVDTFRHRFLEAFSDGAYSSAKDVPYDQDVIAQLRATIARYRQGKLRLDETAVPWRFIDMATALPSSDPPGVHQRDRATVTDYKKMRVPELAQACRDAGIEPAGTKDELIALLTAGDAA
jgi:hypothetical protein